MLLGVSKHGDASLRTKLILGACSVVCCATQNPDLDTWLVKVATR